MVPFMRDAHLENKEEINQSEVSFSDLKTGQAKFLQRACDTLIFCITTSNFEAESERCFFFFYDSRLKTTFLTLSSPAGGGRGWEVPALTLNVYNFFKIQPNT